MVTAITLYLLTATLWLGVIAYLMRTQLALLETRKRSTRIGP